MGVELTCFVLGLAATAFWLSGIRKGIMLGGKRLWLVSGTVLTHRSANTVSFWIATAFFGCFALGLLVLPLLSWIGVRH